MTTLSLVLRPQSQYCVAPEEALQDKLTAVPAILALLAGELRVGGAGMAAVPLKNLLTGVHLLQPLLLPERTIQK